jgi:serine/threonine-protein kinase
MGEVYHARDSRLKRDVAVKVLPDAFAADIDRRARFEREARAVASLAHPHICVVHDVGSQGGVDYIVMELLDGETLAHRLERGPLAVDQLLAHAIQIASALDAAHRHGMTHRDLKPANIMLTKSGVKLLDFGLAKIRDGRGSPVFSAAQTKSDLTAEGTILGTVQYMAPEQLEGGEADARTDIFAFGAILFEMVTGDKAFKGNSSISIMSAILKETPRSVSELRSSTPAPLARLIATCLEKNPDDRWQTARDLLRELRWIATGSSTTSRTDAPWSMRRAAIAAVLIAIGAALLGAAATRWMTSGAVESTVPIRALVPLEQIRLVGEASPLAISHDGSRLIYAGVRPDLAASQLFLHSFSTGETRPIPDTEGATYAFFAPDDERVAFFAGSKLWATSLRGAPPLPLCDAPLGVGGTWADDDTIFFAPSVSSGLWKVSARGGPCQTVTTPNGGPEFSHRLPHTLPGGHALIYTVRRGEGIDALNVLTLATGESHEIVAAGTSGRYVPSGHVVYARAGTLLATPFDLASLRPTGPAVALQELVNHGFEGAQFDVSDAGTLVYVKGHPESGRRRLVWVHPNGTMQPVPGQPGAYRVPRISPDGRYVAVTLGGNTSRSTIYDLSTGVLHELPPSAGYAIWTPKDNRVIFSLALNALVRMGAFRSEEPEVLLPAVRGVPGSMTPDGEWIVYHGVDQASGNIDIWKARLTGSPKPEPLVRTPDRDIGPQLSANGELLAYERDAATNHVYVTRFADGGESLRVSIDGGYEPVWSRTGSTLFYRWRNKMMSVTIQTRPSLRAEPPQEVFSGTFETGSAGLAGYDVAADGRFLMIEAAAADEVHIAWNWVRGLKERLAAMR